MKLKDEAIKLIQERIKIFEGYEQEYKSIENKTILQINVLSNIQEEIGFLKNLILE